MTDSSSALNLTSCTDGNIYMQSANQSSSTDSDNYDFACSQLWAFEQDVLVTDSDFGILHYYNNTMSTVGVSRLRVDSEEAIPAQSVYVAFVPYDDDGDDSTPDIYIAVDPASNVFFPTICQYKNSSMPAKAFLVSELDAGIAMLESGDVEYSVTGGEVDSCHVLTLVQGGDERDQWDSLADDSESDDLDVDLDQSVDDGGEDSLR